jgi:hypothetical protein
MSVGIAFTGGGIFGLVTIVPKMKALGSSLWPALVLVVWTLGAFGITLYHAANVFRRDGLALETIQSEGTGFDSLAELKELHDGGLITQAEFDSKKAEILSRL